MDQAQAKKVARQLNKMLNEFRRGDEDTQPTRGEVESHIIFGLQYEDAVSAAADASIAKPRKAKV